MIGVKKMKNSGGSHFLENENLGMNSLNVRS
jgi:hypothetical protein